jgi:hypothetical protein
MVEGGRAMKLSRKPSAARRRRVFFFVLILILLGGTATVVLGRPDPARKYAASLGFSTQAEVMRARLTLPVDLSAAPYDSYLSASCAAGLDFGKYAGREVIHVTMPIGRAAEQRVVLNVYLTGRKVIGAFLTGADVSVAATPVNSPTLVIEPLN